MGVRKAWKSVYIYARDKECVGVEEACEGGREKFVSGSLKWTIRGTSEDV